MFHWPFIDKNNYLDVDVLVEEEHDNELAKILSSQTQSSRVLKIITIVY